MAGRLKLASLLLVLKSAAKTKKSFALNQCLYPYLAHPRHRVAMRIAMIQMPISKYASIEAKKVLGAKRLHLISTTQIFTAKLLARIVSIQDPRIGLVYETKTLNI